MSKESGVLDQEPSQPPRTQSRRVYPSRPGSSPGRGLRRTPLPLPRPCSLSLEWGTSWAPHTHLADHSSLVSLERTNKLRSRPQSPSSKNRVLKIQMCPRKFLKMWSMFSRASCYPCLGLEPTCRQAPWKGLPHRPAHGVLGETHVTLGSLAVFPHPQRPRGAPPLCASVCPSRASGSHLPECTPRTDSDLVTCHRQARTQPRSSSHPPPQGSHPRESCPSHRPPLLWSRG